MRIVNLDHHLQVQEQVFVESNALIKSIQVFLHALNELRLCHAKERAKPSSLQKQKSSKVDVFHNFSFLHIEA